MRLSAAIPTLEPLANPHATMATNFGTALLFTFPQLLTGIQPAKDCLVWGFVLGVTNILATYFWINTLTHMPGSVAFPPWIWG
jgi:fatty-acid desaturase